MKQKIQNKFFRFRPIDKLIGEYRELEQQIIYFAKPDELNDPIEGYRDVFWSGDAIIWKNFFKHYLLCLERMCSLLIISGEEHPMKADDIPVFSGEYDFPTEIYKKLFNEILTLFFSTNNILLFINQISTRTSPIRRDELNFYFQTIKPIAIESIFHVYGKHGLYKGWKNNHNATNSLDKVVESNYIDEIEKKLKDDRKFENINDLIHLVQRHATTQIDLIARCNGDVDCDSKNKNLVFVDFTEQYINQIEKLLYPDWFTACFMSECTNSSIWGHYASNHTGACLVFTPEHKENGFYLKLYSPDGFGHSGPTHGWHSHKFFPIDYKNGYGQIDFFRSLGRLSKSILDSVWFSSDLGVSNCAEDLYTSETEWRQKYWENFYRDICIKTKDWEYENEHRIILSSSMDTLSEKSDRFIKYDFQSLFGVIFGIKTSKEDKIKLIRIIEQKCKDNGRNDFKFFQAYYSNENQCIDYFEMNFIKFKEQV